MKKKGWIAGAVVTFAVAVIFGLVLSGAHRREENESEEAPIVESSRGVARLPNGDVVIQLSRDEQARVGLRIEALKEVTTPVEFTAYGAVVDPFPLITLNSQLESARANLSASRSQFDRAKLLYSEKQNLSLKDVQMAEAKFRADHAQFALFQQQIADNWGERINTTTPASRAALIAALVRREQGIVRVSVPPDESISERPRTVRVLVLGYETRPLRADWIVFDPTVNPQLQGQGFLLGVAAQGFPLRPGAAVTARIERAGPPQHGFVIPDSAILRIGDVSCVYLAMGTTQFERRPVPLTERKENGWFVDNGFAAGDRIVITGAQTLLSEELRSQISSGERERD